MIINLEQYEAAIASLALRQFSLAQLEIAMAAYKAGKVSDGQDASDRAQVATHIADKIQQG